MISHYRQLEWATIRVKPAGKAPIGAWQGRTDEPDAFEPGENVGVRLGAPSGGLVDIDLDCPEGVALAPRFLPLTATFGRPSKPRSHWLYTSPGIRTRKPPHTHVELRSTGCQTVFPSSFHESGEPITWTDGTEVTQIDEHALLAAFGRLCAATIIARAWPGLEGNKHDTVLAVAGALWREGWTVEDAVDTLIPAMELDGSSEPHREDAIRDTWGEHDRDRLGWPSVEKILGPQLARALQRAVKTVPGAVEAPSEQPKGEHPQTDTGNAERMLDAHGDTLRHVKGLGWIKWSETHWSALDTPIEQYVETMRGLRQHAVDSGQPTVAKWALQSENASRLNAAIKLAKDLPGFQTDVEAFDANPWLLNCPNGTVDLRTGQLREHDRGDHMTKLVAVEYDPAATAPRFDRFMGEVFCDDVELATYVLRYLGYSLTGLVSEQVFQIWHGAGSNGKSTLIDTLCYVLGDYAQTLAADMLMKRRQGRSSEAASPDVARLRGVRLAAGSETEAGQRWDESRVKSLTGGDRVVARHLYGKPFEIDPTWKLVLAVNHKPTVRDRGHGMWRRIHLVPFQARFSGAQMDRSLPEKLRAEASGILTMLVTACLAWQREGLNPPPAVMLAGKQYRESQDVIGQFLEECVVEGDDRTAERSKLYQAYRRWAIESGEHVFGKHLFNNDLRDRGWVDKKTGVWRWEGVALRSDASFGAL